MGGAFRRLGATRMSRLGNAESGARRPGTCGQVAWGGCCRWISTSPGKRRQSSSDSMVLPRLWRRYGHRRAFHLGDYWGDGGHRGGGDPNAPFGFRSWITVLYGFVAVTAGGRDGVFEPPPRTRGDLQESGA